MEPAKPAPEEPTFSITEAKRIWPGVVERAESGERIIITKWGKPIAAMQAYDVAPRQHHADASPK